MPLANPGSTDRSRVRRIPHKEVRDREVAYAILDSAFVAHVAVVAEGQPYVLPVAYARREDEVVFHGSNASRLFRALATGQPTCFTVTLLDAMVFARSLFESSMNYRGVMVLGSCRRLEGDDEIDALRVVSEHLQPGRWDVARQPSRKELAATMTLALPLDECSVKVGDGPPDDVPSDLTDPVYRRVWGGRVPLVTSWGEPVPDEYSQGDPLPERLGHWTRP